MKKRIATGCMLLTLAALNLKAAAPSDISTYIPGSDEGIVYFLPKTALQINLIATKVSYQPGELCQYANRYLRQSNVTSQPETHWEIKQIDVRSIGIPDSTKAYSIKLKDKSTASNIELTEDGIIKAINTSSHLPQEEANYKLEKSEAPENARKYMTEDILMAGSTAKMADLTAKEIYNIRESKNLILRGQADTMPKDGASLKLIIDNLNKQEKALTELFTGVTHKEDKLFTFQITPQGEDMNNQIVCRFSSRLGVLETENLAGEPIYVSLKNSSTTSASSSEEDEAKKKKKLEGAIYNIPGKGMVSVSFQGKVFFDSELPITQFGNTEVLVNDLFTKKINTRVIFNPATGSILKIDKD